MDSIKEEICINKMFQDLPQHIINYIYTFDDRWKNEYDEVIMEINVLLMPFSHIEYDPSDTHPYRTMYGSCNGNLVSIVKKNGGISMPSKFYMLCIKTDGY